MEENCKKHFPFIGNTKLWLSWEQIHDNVDHAHRIAVRS